MGGHRDWRTIIEGSGLPVEARRVIRQVVGDTRLWKREREEVAIELVAHFADGLEAGRSMEQLLSEFGDPRKTAKLIRRAKKRNRGWLWQAIRRFAQFVGVVMLFYIGMWAWLMTSRPEPRTDYVAQMNVEASAVAPEDRAWPIYRQAWIAGKIWDVKFDVVTDEVGRLVRPGEAGWEKVAGFLDEHDVLVEAARRGGMKRGLGLKVGRSRDYSEEDRMAFYGPDANRMQQASDASFLDRLVNESVMGVLLPHLGPIRTMGRLLELDMDSAAERGEGERVVENYRAMLGMARQVRESGLLINQLVAVRIVRQADEVLMRILDRRAAALSREQWLEVAHESAGSERLCRIDLSGEQVFMDDFLQRFYSDDGQGDGHVTFEGLRMLQLMGPELSGDGRSGVDAGAITSAALPLAYMVMASRGQVKERADRLFGLMQLHADKPLWEQLKAEGAGAEQELVGMASSIWTRTRYLPLVLLMPALERAGQAGQETKAVNDAVGVAIGLELYRREHGGRYPTQLEQLVPRYVPTIPVDHSTGQELLYVLKEREDRSAETAADKDKSVPRPVLYGRGLDGDDDGGVRDEKEKDRWPRVAKEGDWVLYPAEK